MLLPFYILLHQYLVLFLFNPLNAKLNPICHFLALLAAHPILHVRRIRVKLVYLLLRMYQAYFLFGRPRIHILARRRAVLSGVVVVFLRLSGKSLNSTGSYTRTGSFNIC